MKHFTARNWFRPWGWISPPIHPIGYILTLLPLAFVIHTFLAIDRKSHSATDTLYAIFPYASASFLLWLWVADRSSRSTSAT